MVENIFAPARALSLRYSIRGLGIVAAAVSLAGCGGSGAGQSAPPETAASASTATPAAEIALRQGDVVTYRFTGTFSKVPVAVRAKVADVSNGNVTVLVTAKRGREKRDEQVTLAPREDGTMPTLLEELLGGALPTIAPWVVPALEGTPTPGESRACEARVSGAEHMCQCRKESVTFNGKAYDRETRRCPSFLWTDGPARMSDGTSGNDVWKVDVVEGDRDF